MSFLSGIRVALGALLIHKGRSILTSLGIIIGISAVIGLVSAGEGARHQLQERLGTVGTNLILIQAGTRSQMGMLADFTPLTRDDAAAIRKQVGSLLTGVAEFQVALRVASSRFANWTTMATGTTPEMQLLRDWTLSSGRFITESDLKRMGPVGVLGHTARKKLFPDMPNPVGEIVRMGTLRLQVVGVLEAKGRNPAGVDQDDEIFLPITTLQHKLAGEERINMILSAARSANVTPEAMQLIADVLRERHRVKPGTEDFSVSSVREMAQLGFLVTDTLEWLVIGIALISLVVGGIGIMNIMLASVTERTREIGVRMAVGATPAEVLTQFLFESLILAGTGGLIGISMGVSAAAGIASLAGWPVTISPLLVLGAFGITATVGVIFGLYPAWKASRLDPIEALRYE